MITMKNAGGCGPGFSDVRIWEEGGNLAFLSTSGESKHSVHVELNPRQVDYLLKRVLDHPSFRHAHADPLIEGDSL